MRRRHETFRAVHTAARFWVDVLVCPSAAVKRHLAQLVVLSVAAIAAGVLVTTHAQADAASKISRSSGRVTGITTIYPWEAEARASALSNGELAAGSGSALIRGPGVTPPGVEHRNSASRTAELPGAGDALTWGVAQESAAQRSVTGRRALPSSGIGSRGANSVSQPERSLVEVLLGGNIAGLGVVLEGGAVLTSLATIGRGLELSLRFADGSVEVASVRRTHRAYDLALLEPMGEKVRPGLPLARVLVEPLKLLERRSDEARSISSSKSLFVHATRVVPVSWFGAVWGADGVSISGAIRPPPLTELGSPLITSSGHLAALVTLGCVAPLELADKGPVGCQLTRVGLASGALGEFLGMLELEPTHVWFGLSGETTDTGWARGVRVTGVNPGSPAANAGLKASSETASGDVIVALDDIPVHDVAQLKAAFSTHHSGVERRLTVLREGKLVQLPISPL